MMAGGPLTRPIVEAFNGLSPQLQTAARYVLDCPDDVALLSMREQARRAGVPAATMTRLAKRLGLEGYDEARALYAGAVRDGTLGFAGKAGVQVETQKLRGERALAADMALTLSRQIARLAETPTLDRLADAAGRLHQARRIYCLGLRSCHGIAWHFHYMLSLLGDKTVMLDDAGGIGLDAIRDAGPRRQREIMTHILYRQTANLPVATGGKGIELIDSTGKRYLDASGGAAVSCLGHGHPAVTAALHEQLDKLAYVHTSFFTTEVAEKLGDRLIEDAPAGLSHVYVVSGGSEAVESALKMARQYFTERGETKR